MSAFSSLLYAQPAPHIATMFPAGVAAFEAHGPCSTDVLFDTERACIAHAVETRAREFAAGRACARAALSRLGLPPEPIPAGPDRAPIWPPGFAGSISHTQGYCVAVAGHVQKEQGKSGFLALGVDVEQAGQVHPELWPQVMREEEIAWLCTLSEAERAVSAALIFSAKEAFYKAQYALTQAWVDFDDAAVELVAGSFVLHVRNDTLPIARHARSFKGRFWVCAEHVVTGLAI